MPLPSQLHRDKALENISVAYMPNEFIADRLVPKIPVMHESDVYYVFDQNIMSLPETLRADGSEAREASYDLSTSSYKLAEHALKDIVTDRMRQNADKAIKPDIDATEVLTKRILIRKEVECANIAFDKSNFSNNASLAAAAAWSSNTTTTNPITSIDSATSKIIASSGYTPNKLVIDDPTFRACKNHVSVIDRVKYTTADSITENMLAKLFNVQEILVGRALRDTAQEGLTNSMNFVWSSCAFLAYMESSPGLRKASAMYQFLGMGAGSPFTVTKWREESRKGDMVEVSSLFQYKAIATQCAYLILKTVQ
jgi:hypothetical protein